MHSPDGPGFYRANQTDLPLSDLSCSMGIGGRPTYVSGYRNAGPGAYEPCLSAAKKKSAVDGPEFCTTTLKKRLPMKGLGHKDEGPGHAYTVTAKTGEGQPAYSMQGLYTTKPRELGELNAPDVFPGIGAPEWGNHQRPKYTLAQQERFPKKGRTVSESPDGVRYYSHCKLYDDHGSSVTCTLGRGGKTNFARLGEGGKNRFVGPGSYDPIASVSRSTSALDGALRALVSGRVTK
jgi:hypothetical protein